ncbi:MAG: glycosyltransferase 87 family protein [Candidatus Kariarchaeaceae archaeon]|jgi:hypothetical protein
MEEDNLILSHSNNNLFFLPTKMNRTFFYISGLILRILIAGIFIDSSDGLVFFETGEDIIIRHTNIYNEDSMQRKFNYFPLAYLAVLPGLFIYFALSIKNSILQRILQKLPMILLELILAYYMRRKKSDKMISSYELFILFNPILIYSSCVKGQFDIFPAFLLLLAWNSYKRDNQIKSGIYSAAAILFKPYGIIFIMYLAIILLKNDYRKFRKYIVGNMTVVFPILLFASFLNFQGLIDHAIIFHLKRAPNGHSLTTSLYLSIQYIGDIFLSENVTGVLSSILLISLTILLLIILILLAIRIWTHEQSNKTILETLILGFVVLFLLNKTFFFHYLPILVVLWIEYKRERSQIISNEQLAWNYIYLPIIGIFKIYWMVPSDIRDFIGSYWLAVIYITSLLFHFIISFSILKIGRPIFRNKYVLYTYILFLILVPFHFAGMYHLAY